jgi:hypothetical protein
MKMKLLIGMVLLMALGLTATTQAAAVVDAEATQVGCPAQPQGNQIGPRDRTRGANAPRDGRGPGRGQALGARDGSGARVGGQAWGPQDGSGFRRGFGGGQRNGTGPRQGRGWGMRNGTGPGACQIR